MKSGWSRGDVFTFVATMLTLAGVLVSIYMPEIRETAGLESDTLPQVPLGRLAGAIEYPEFEGYFCEPTINGYCDNDLTYRCNGDDSPTVVDSLKDFLDVNVGDIVRFEFDSCDARFSPESSYVYFGTPGLAWGLDLEIDKSDEGDIFFSNDYNISNSGMRGYFVILTHHATAPGSEWTRAVVRPVKREDLAR